MIETQTVSDVKILADFPGVLSIEGPSINAVAVRHAARIIRLGGKAEQRRRQRVSTSADLFRIAGYVVRECIVAVGRAVRVVALPDELIAEFEFMDSSRPIKSLRKIYDRTADRVGVLHAATAPRGGKAYG